MTKSTIYKQDSKFWIALIDMMTSILIIFLLVSFIDSILNPRNIELALIEKKRNEFIQLLNQEFSGEISKGKIKLTKQFDHLQITFSDGILFPPASHYLQGTGRYVLLKCAKTIHAYTNLGNIKDIKTIQVEGHTDTIRLERTTYPKNNWELSTARALSVINYFESKRIPKQLFSASGHEANQSFSENLVENRRIELKIFFSP